jgi:glutamyl-tRNA reductase
LLLIDIAVPRDIDPAVNFLENVYLYNIDDLQAIADDYLKQRKDEIAVCEKIIAEKIKSLLETKNLPPPDEDVLRVASRIQPEPNA